MATVEAVMRQINNFFERAYYDGAFLIADGVITLPESLPAGSWIAIQGSLYHNGVHQLTDDYKLDGPDEEFNGRVWLLFPPAHFLNLCEQIAEFDEKTPAGAFQSEALGEYSYSRATGKNGGLLTWKEAFKDELMPYRRMFTEVSV